MNTKKSCKNYTNYCERYKMTMATYQDIKLCLLGDSGVGKSSIVQRFVNNSFNPTAESTIGASFMTKTLVIDNATFKFNIWDTAGQERYRALAPMYYRGAGAAVIVYDVTDSNTFYAVKSWVKELQLHGPCQIVLALAGNKSDLVERREVATATAKSYAESIGAVLVETSALNATNINELFTQICLRMPKPMIHEPTSHSLKLSRSSSKSTKKCC